MDNVLITTISKKYKSIRPFFDERSKRVWATAEAKSIGRGDPMTPLLWTSKSLSKIVVALQEEKHKVGITTVRKLLKQLGDSLQSNRKRREGEDHHCRQRRE